jgi:hypothetical protein
MSHIADTVKDNTAIIRSDNRHEGEDIFLSVFHRNKHYLTHPILLANLKGDSGGRQM